MTTTHCQHEDVALVCPFGCGETVDSDTYVCSKCQDMVAPNAACVLCESVIMEAVPHGMGMDHVRATVEDQRQEAVLMAQLTASLCHDDHHMASAEQMGARTDLPTADDYDDPTEGLTDGTY